MDKMFEYESGSEGEVILKFRLPRVDLFPKGAGDHFRNAQKELLLAFLSYIDAAVERVERPEQERQGRTRIEVT